MIWTTNCINHFNTIKTHIRVISDDWDIEFFKVKHLIILFLRFNEQFPHHDFLKVILHFIYCDIGCSKWPIKINFFNLSLFISFWILKNLLINVWISFLNCSFELKWEFLSISINSIFLMFFKRFNFEHISPWVSLLIFINFLLIHNLHFIVKSHYLLLS